MIHCNCSLAGFSFQITAGETVLNSLPKIKKQSPASPVNARAIFTAVPCLSLKKSTCTHKPCLTQDFLKPRYIGGGVQTFPLMLNAERKLLVDNLLTNGAKAESLPLLSVPAVANRIEECRNHASEVLLILHSLTVEIRDFHEHRIDVFYLEEMESLLSSEFAHEGYRRMFSMFLPDFDALMIHSSALLRNGKTIMFLAADEGGKSTAVGLASQGKILSDDRNILKRDGSGFAVHSTPWGKICNLEISAPLGGMFLLEKSDSFSLEPLDPRVLVYFLWEDNRPFWDHLPVSRRTKVLDLLISASRSVPVYRMHFPKDHIDWAALDSAVAD